MVSPEGLATIEANAETLLQEVGVEFRDNPAAHKRFADAGADVKGVRVRFPKGLARSLCKTAPAQYIQCACSSARNVVIGGDHVVFAPNYGSPFVHDLDRGYRRISLCVQASRRTSGLRKRSDASADDSGGHEFRPARRRLNGRRFLRLIRKIRHGLRPARHDAVLAKGVDFSANGLSMEAFAQVEPGGQFLGCAHTQANFEQAFYRSEISDANPFEQWREEGSRNAAARSDGIWK